MTIKDFNPNAMTAFLAIESSIPAKRIAAWASNDAPLAPIALTPDLADSSDALLDVLAKYTRSEHIPQFRAAITDGDRGALEAMQYAVNDIRERLSTVVPETLETCREWFDSEQYQAVAGLCPDIGAIAWAVGDLQNAVNLYYLAARSFWKIGDANSTVAMYELAIPLGEKFASSFTEPQRTNVMKSLAALYDNLGLALTDLERFDEAAVLNQRSLQLEPDSLRKLIIRNNLGKIYLDLGEYALAVREYKKIWDELSNTKVGQVDETQVAIALDNWSVALIQDGKVAEALPLLEQAAQIFPKAATAARARNASNLLSGYKQAGRYSEAAAVFREAWKLALEGSRPQDIDHFKNGHYNALRHLLPPTNDIWDLFTAASAATGARDWERAIGIFEAVTEIARDSGDHLTYLRSVANIASNLAEAEQIDDALRLSETVRGQALRAGLALPVALSAVTTANLMHGGSDQGALAGALPTTAEALVYAKLHQQLADETNLPPDDDIKRLGRVDVGVLQAQVAEAAKDAHAYDLAEEYYRDAISSLQHIADRYGEVIRFGELNRKVGLLTVLDKTPERSAEADVLAHELRAELADTDTPPIVRYRILSYLGTRGSHTPASLADLRAAAAIAETLRAELAPGAVRNDLDRQFRVYPLLLRRLQESDATAAEEFSVLQAMRARRLMEMLTATAGDSRPYQPIEVGEVQELLDGQPRLTTFVDVTATDSGLRAYLVDQTELRTVDVTGDVGTLIAVQWGDILQRAAEVVALVAHSKLLSNFASAITDRLENGSTVLLSVDDGLANLPLHAIPVDDTPWGDMVSIGRIPAAGVLRFTRKNRNWRGRAVVAGDSNKDLPGAHQECVEVARDLGVKALLEDDCTIDAVVDALTAVPDDRLDVVHLAVHGRADAQRGGRSSLLFAGDPRQWVTFAELAALPWNADLIVFSGCSTAVGGPRNGLGLYGVAQAAAEAGATTVIASLWPVDDISAEKFMTAFYSELSSRRGTGLIDLRELMDHARTQVRETAKLGGLSVRRDGRELIIAEQEAESPPTDTYEAGMMHWAPFVLIGEPTLVV
jgi:CHAT domain-containing protein/tetratricopeptide (TPR) repeat protein